MSRTTDDATDEEHKEITATVSVNAVLKALELNDIISADDRVIAIPQRDGAEASVRRAFRGSERYANPSAAPVHVRPEELVEDEFARPPRRSRAIEHVRTEHDLRGSVDTWDEEYQQQVESAHEQQVEMWRQDTAGMIEGDNHLGECKSANITLIGGSDR